ncbi:MAG: hypothetical protein PVF40_12030 [Ectothiorhodospiraceae bacterium]|jgi:hypothetical protein
MNSRHRIAKQQLVRILDENRFNHLTSSVHVLGTRRAGKHELAGVSIYSNPRGWMAQVNWRAIVDSDEITLRVGDADSGERAYELRDEQRLRVCVEDEGGTPVSDDEVATLVAQSQLAKSWEQDVVDVLKESQDRQATVH